MNKIILLLTAVVLAACAVGGGSELSRNQAKWQQADIDHYRFQLGVSCFCPVSGLMPMTVEVQDGEVVSITDVNGEAFPESDPMYDFILRYATIERQFAELQSKEVQGADELSVAYDSEYGYPSEVAIDFIEQAVDDELYLSVSNFEPIS
jgi:hypothetical protein